MGDLDGRPLVGTVVMLLIIGRCFSMGNGKRCSNK